MTVLYLDTTTNFLYAGIVSENQLLVEVKQKLDKDLSVYTLPKIKEMFEEIAMEPIEIDRIMVVNGPGSFTGIRIGVTIAKIYANFLKKEITTISSLEAMAVSCNTEVSYKVPAIDARRNAVFAAIFDCKEVVPVLREQYIRIEDLEVACKSLPGEYCWISNQDLKTDEKILSYDPDILNIVNTYCDRPTVNPHSVNPEYLKLTEAEESKRAEEV